MNHPEPAESAHGPGDAGRTSEIDPAPTESGATRPIPAEGRPPIPDGPGSLQVARGWEPVPGYQVERRLGRGGFGEVWSAVGPGGVVLALKLIPLDADPGELEVRALDFMKNVHHPHLTGVSGVWRTADLLIIAMELADGTLGDACRDAAEDGGAGIAPATLLEYFREAAKGIDYLHTLGIVHRDIKPPNILLMSGGVKVADFGLARLTDHPGRASRLSMTPSYAAPELCRGESGPGTDQYALAVTYCELRGGRLPFVGGVLQVIAGHTHHAPDLSMLPPGERPIVARALAKDPAARFPDCRSFIAALADASPRPDPAPTWIADPPRVQPSRRGWLAAVGSVGLLASAAGSTAAWVRLARRDPLEDIRREEILRTVRNMRRQPDDPVRTFAPGMAEVDRIEPNPNLAFEVYRDERVVDLRGWRPVPSDRLDDLISSVTQTRHIWLSKTRPAATLHFLGRTSGAEIFFRCDKHFPFSEVAQRSRVIFGNERMLVREIVIDVSALDVGEDFALKVSSTYWNTLQTPRELWFGVNGSSTASKISQLILFPDGKPYQSFQLKTIGPDRGEPRPYNGPVSILTGPNRDWINWDIVQPLNNVTYRTDWTW